MLFDSIMPLALQLRPYLIDTVAQSRSRNFVSSLNSRDAMHNLVSLSVETAVGHVNVDSCRSRFSQNMLHPDTRHMNMT